MHLSKNNLIFSGLHKDENESSAFLLNNVPDQLSSKIFISSNGIERCHRFSSPNNYNIRPRVYKVIDFRKKSFILKNASKRKGTRLFINKDSSLRVRNIRRQIWLGTADLRRNSAKAVLRYGYALADNTHYKWNASNNCLVMVLPHRLPNYDN